MEDNYMEDVRIAIAEVASIQDHLVDDDSSLTDDLGLDEYGIEEVLDVLEAKLDIDMEDRDYSFEYVSDIIQVVESLLQPSDL